MAAARTAPLGENQSMPAKTAVKTANTITANRIILGNGLRIFLPGCILLIYIPAALCALFGKTTKIGYQQLVTFRTANGEDTENRQGDKQTKSDP